MLSINALLSVAAIGFLSLKLIRWYLREAVYGSIDISNEISVQGKVVLVTGANAGIGKATVEEFAKRDAIVILACRDINRAEQAVKDIRKKTLLGELTCMKLDLASLQSVRDFCKEFKAKFDRLDILINNGGVLFHPQDRMKTNDGFEIHMGVNHLGHFLLTNLLLDLMKKSTPSRIIHVSSIGHSLFPFDVNDLMSEKGEMKNPTKLGTNYLYSRSKMAQMLFNKELAKKLEGTGVNTYALCPGAVDTDIAKNFRDYSAFILFTLLGPAFRYLAKSPEEGAATTMYCALSKDLTNASGQAYQNCGYWDPSKRAVLDDEEAKKLWQESAKLVGI